MKRTAATIAAITVSLALLSGCATPEFAAAPDNTPLVSPVPEAPQASDAPAGSISGAEGEVVPAAPDTVDIDVEGWIAKAKSTAQKVKDWAATPTVEGNADSAWNGITYTAADASAALPQLIVAKDGSMAGYDRDGKFPHWATSDLGAGCDIRDAILYRDALSATIGSGCAIQGTWADPYTGSTITQASDLDIDHIVSLAEAYRTGAAAWTQDERISYANSPLVALATDDGANQAKGDRGPEEWKPTNATVHCAFAVRYVEVKATYSLTTTADEIAALQGMLATCA